MSRRHYAACVLLTLCLTACTNKEEAPSEPVTPPLTERSESYSYEGLTFYGVGSQTGFLETSEGLEIHPYFDNIKHILVKEVNLSGQGFWDTICKSDDTNVIEHFEGWDILTNTSGITFGFWQLDENNAWVFQTDSLPSSYVKVVMDKACQ